MPHAGNSCDVWNNLHNPNFMKKEINWLVMEISNFKM